MNEEPGFIVSLRDVWDAQQETNRQVASLVAQLPAHVLATTEDIADIRKQIDDHEARIRGLEQRFWKFAGAISAVFLAASALEAIYYFTHH